MRACARMLILITAYVPDRADLTFCSWCTVLPLLIDLLWSFCPVCLACGGAGTFLRASLQMASEWWSNLPNAARMSWSA